MDGGGGGRGGGGEVSSIEDIGTGGGISEEDREPTAAFG